MKREHRGLSQHRSIDPFIGEHCETTVLGQLLRHEGIELSEHMIFGLSRAFSFRSSFVPSLGYPSITGRPPPGVPTKNLCQALNLEYVSHRTRNSEAAWERVKKIVDQGRPVAVTAHCYYLEYLPERFRYHFGGHFITVYDYDAINVYLVELERLGKQVVLSRRSFCKARNARAPFSTPNLSFFFRARSNRIDGTEILPRIIRTNVQEFAGNVLPRWGLTNLREFPVNLRGWLEDPHYASQVPKRFRRLINDWGTGGGLYRRIYAKFLDEAAQHLQRVELAEGGRKCRHIADRWDTFGDELLSVKPGKASQIDRVVLLATELLAEEEELAEILKGI